MTRDMRHRRFRAAFARIGRAARPGVVGALLGTVLGVVPGSAQQVPSPLTLAEALRLARENNPQFLSLQNDVGVSDWDVREAYGSFLPSVAAAGRFGYTAPGVQTYSILTLASQATGTLSSAYSLGLSWRLDGNSIFEVSSARAARRATEAGVDAQLFQLESVVTLRYMAVLRAEDELDVFTRQLARAERNLGIVQARVASGAAAGIEGKQAEVERGRRQVDMIRAEQGLRNQELQLMEQIGLPLEGDLQLRREFDVFEPGWTLAELTSLALESHPWLEAAAAQEDAARAKVRQARSQYFPALTLSTGWSGFTNQSTNSDFELTKAERGARSAFDSCNRWLTIQNGLGTELPGLDLGDGCGSPELSDAQRRSVLASNDAFPFDFTKSPLSFSATVSIPLFQGFSRERQSATASAASRDAQHQRRAEELRIRRAVTEAYNAMAAAWEVVRIEERNVELAGDRLDAARQRYSMGAAPAQPASAGSTFLELLDAEASLSTAERDHLTAVYDFHQGLAQLEEATGRRLAPAGVGAN